MFTELLHSRQHQAGVEHFRRLFRIPDELPSLQHLGAILKAFSRLPYENLSKILKLHRTAPTNLPFRLPSEVIADHDLYRLGGTCFALTFTLKCILDYYGYQSEILMADMKFAPNSHCLLLLKYEGREYLIDPGYLIQRPLDLSQREQLIGLRLNYDTETQRYELWTAERNQLQWRYAFQKKPVDLETFGRLWLDSFHWFTMHGICLSRRDTEGFLYIHNHYIKRITDSEYIKGHFQEDLGEVIQRYFKIEKEVYQKAQKALAENLCRDQELGYYQPRQRCPRYA